MPIIVKTVHNLNFILGILKLVLYFARGCDIIFKRIISTKFNFNNAFGCFGGL